MIPSPAVVSSLVRRAVLCCATIASVGAAMVGCSEPVPERLTWDADGVAHGVLALVPFNRRWAATQRPDAVLYRIEIRADNVSDRPPATVIYSFYAPRSETFMSASSDPVLPWDGAAPQLWPTEAPAPLPLPPLRVDFDSVWARARRAGIRKVTRVILEVNQRNQLPLPVWTVVGELPGTAESGVWFDAISGDRIYGHAVLEPTVSAAQIDAAVSAYRGALRGDDGSSGRCATGTIDVPQRRPVTCFDVLKRVYSRPK